MVGQQTVRFADVPILSLQAYKEGTPSDKTEFLSGLQKSWDSRYGGQGFGKFIDTGLDVSFTADMLRESRFFFENLNTSQKERYNLHCRGQRGYTGFGVEGAKDRAIGDLKEILMWGRDGIPGEPTNIHPFEVPGLRGVSMYAYERIEEDNRILYKAVAEILDVDPRYFDWDWQNGRKPNSGLRSLYYPAVEQDLIERLQRESGTNDMPVRAAEHADINRATWLYLGESSEGLQIKQGDGSWDDVCVSKEFAIVNVGDLLCTETDGILPSAIHRVLVTQSAMPRYSFPCFTHPAKEKYLRRIVTHPQNPGKVYRNAMIEVYGKEVFDLLHPEIQENLGLGRLRIVYDHFLE